MIENILMRYKLFWISLIFILSCSLFKHQEPERIKIQFNNETTQVPKEITLRNQTYLWYELTPTKKIAMILNFVESGNGAVKYQIPSTTNDSIDYFVALEIIKIKDCMDDRAFLLYLSYENDLEIGNALIECAKELKMFN